MPAAQIQLDGMKELRKSLKGFETDTAWRPALRNAYSAIATMVEQSAVAASAVSRMGSVARGTIKGKGTVTGATLKGGSAGVPWFAGYNFGSNGRYRQFPVKRSPDYFLYATIERERARIQEETLDAIDRALSAEGL